MRITQASGGLLGELSTTPWYATISFGLGLVIVACVIFWLGVRVETRVENSGCLSVLLGFLGIVFALTGFTALFMGFFGGS